MFTVLNCLSQRHNTVPPLRLEPAAPKYQVEHSSRQGLS